MSRYTFLFAMTLYVLCCLDGALTIVGLSLGATEENPLMANLILWSPAMFLLLKCVLLPGMLLMTLSRVSAGVRIRWLVPALVATNVVYVLVMFQHGITLFYLTV